MAVNVGAVRGMADVLPPDSERWRWLESTAYECFLQYGYQEIRTPMVEFLQLFERQLGTATDVVGKEMYTFVDGHNADTLALRPEATVPTVRAVLASGAVRAGVVRVQYGGAMFRRERPQRGRYRQFHQIGVEALGSDSPMVEVEQITMLARLWQRLGMGGGLCLRLNNLGSLAERQSYKAKLVDFFSHYRADLDEPSLRQLSTNPLRLLDSKDKNVVKLLGDVPLLEAELGAESRAHDERVKDCLAAAGVSFTIDPLLVRGLDYYNLTVYEWAPSGDERRQATVCGGGRYDGLAAMLGGNEVAGCGFAMGVERVLAMASPPPAQNGWVYLVVAEESCDAYANGVAEQCRTAGVRVVRHVGGGRLAKQLKKANLIKCGFAIIVGDDEKTNGVITLKNLQSGQQHRGEVSALIKLIQQETT